MEKKIYLGMFFMVLVLLVGFVSAGFLDDFYARITGKAQSSTTALNITIGNSAPTVSFVAAIPAITPNENGVNYTEFIINATDADGVANLDDNSAEARFELSGETTRVNASCILLADIDANSANYSCTVGMYYFDKNDASWTVNATILDTNGARGINASTSVTFNPLTAMVMSPTALTWAEFGVADTNQESDNDPIILNNTGNGVDLSINVTGLNLQGEETPTQFIFAANLTVNNVTADCPGGTAMLNATSLNVTSTILQRGNNSLNNNNATSGQEQMFFCVTAVNPDISSQSYSSAAYGTWTIQII